MQYIKTLKKFVAGSDKYFDVFHCTVDEVSEFKDSSSRRSVRIKVGDKTFQGLWNKSIFEFLVENEGSESFIVLWKSNKGNYMVSYAWELWEAYSKGDEQYDSKISEVEPHTTTENKEAFVYMWINHESDMKYIGMHKGHPQDGYICSNDRLLSEYNAAPYQFRRTILAYGSQQDMHELETLLLIQLRAANGDMYYNLSNNLRK